MKLQAYTVYDLKAEVFHAPFFAVNHASAIRSFEDLSNDLQTSVGRHPADYILYCVGSFDDAAGVLSPMDRSHIANAVQLVRNNRPDGLFEDAHSGVRSEVTADIAAELKRKVGPTDRR